MLKLILASQSPRRKALLHQAGFSFTALPTNISETPDKNLNLEGQVLKIAQQKAEACLEEHKYLKSNDFIILGADTMVIVDDIAYGKPSDLREAEFYLRLLSGRDHVVMTGLHLINCRTFEQDFELTTTRVFFRSLSDREINEYIATGEPMDKAGAYGIQGLGETFVVRLEGDLDNVIGLSIRSFRNLLAKNGWTIE